jgi:capsular polysaccharide biosynthesis protein
LGLATPDAVIAPGDLARLALSAPVLADVTARLRLRTSSARVAALTRVTFDSSSGLTTIATRANDGDRARAVANTFSDATVAAYRALAQRRSDGLVRKLQRQSSDLRAKLRSYDAQIRAAARHDAQTAPAQSTETARRIADLEGRRAAAVASLVAARAADSRAPAATAAQQVPTPAPAAPIDSYPGVVAVQETPLPTPVPVAPAHAAGGRAEAALTQQIGTIDAEIAALRARPSTQRRPSGTANRLLSDRKKTARALEKNRRALARAEYDRAAALAALTVQGRSEFVQRLIPPAAAVGVVVAAGVGLAIGAAYLAEAVDPRIRRSRHVEKLYGKPHIGSV